MTILARLARNTAVSVVAFGINGLVGLALVPILVGAYGIAQFGLLILSRTLLPAGAFALFDLGVSETATQTVGRARGSGEWGRAAEDLGLLLVLAAAVGVALALALAGCAAPLADLFASAAGEHESFAAILSATGLLLAVVFPGLVAEGVVKGFERFGVLRAVEVVATLLYAAIAVACVALGLSYAAVAYGFLGAVLVRTLTLAAVAAGEMRRAGLRPRRWGEASRADVLRRSFLLFQNKALGMLQMPVPPLVIGALLGPGAVGLYEIITRLPRFLKSTLSLLASAVLPVAARLEGRGAQDHLGRLGAQSFWLVPYAVFPVLFACAGLSRPILELWVGREIAAYWPWFAVMLAFPILQVCLFVSQTALQVKPEYMAASNRIAAAGVVLQFAVSLALAGRLGPMSFVLGIAVATAATFPFLLHVIARFLGVPVASLWRPVLAHGALALVLALALGAAESAGMGTLALLVALGIGLAAFWGLAYGLLLEQAARALVGRLASSLLHGARA